MDYAVHSEDSPPLPQDEIVYLQRLVATRWVAGALLVLATFFSVRFLGLLLPEFELYVLAVIILLYNLALAAIVARVRRQSLHISGLSKRLLEFQILLDLLSLLVFVHFTGGLTSPGLALLFLHAIIVTILVGGIAPYMYILVSLISVVLIGLFESEGFLAHFIVIPYVSADLHQNGLFLLIQVGFLAMGMLAAAAITSSIMGPLRQRERQLSALFQITESVSESLEVDTVLGRLAEEMSAALRPQAVTVHLLQLDGHTLTRRATVGYGFPEHADIDNRNTNLYNKAMAGQIVSVSGAEARRDAAFAGLGMELQHIILVPMINDRTLGICSVYFSIRPDNVAALEGFLKAIARVGANAIERAMVHAALQRAEQQRTQFVHIVTHELRSPVTGAQSLLRVLTGDLLGTLSEQQRDILSRLSRRMDALLVLINDLLALAAARARDFQQPLQTLVLQDTVEVVINEYCYQAQEKSIELLTELDADGIKALVTEDGWQRIVSNLVGNAIKYTSEGGIVKVKLSADHEHISLLVVDTGIGIPADNIEKLGTDFYRADNARSSGILGTGLGLATVKQFVNTFQGQMVVNSVVGEGTTFTISIPRSE